VVSRGAGYVADQGFNYDNAVYVYGGYPQWGGQMARYDIPSNSWSHVALGDDDGLYTNGGGGLIGNQWYKVHREGFLMHYNAATDTFEADISITALLMGSTVRDNQPPRPEPTRAGLRFPLPRYPTLRR